MHGCIFTHDHSILVTTHWDSHFSFLCSSKKNIEEIYRKLQNPAPQLIPFGSNVKKILWDDINYSKAPFYPFNDVEVFKKYKVDSGYAKKGDTKALIDIIKLMGYSNTKNNPIEGIRTIEQFNR